MAYGDFKGLNRRTSADKVVHDKAFNIVNNPNYDGYQRGLASMVYEFFDKKNFWEWYKKWEYFKQKLAEELHKQNIRKF